MVIYYQLPDLKAADQITMEIKDTEGNLVRTFSSRADSTYKKYDGGPPEEPVLSKIKGVNRFVWDMRYTTIPGVPGVYIEGNYRRHKASPGNYTITIKKGNQQVSEAGSILSNPLYSTDASTYKEYHTVMNRMETELIKMHQTVNTIYTKLEQLNLILASLPSEEKFNKIKKEGQSLAARMKSWDEEMIQRKSKAYDDVDNFDNKFTANYMFLINQTESDLPRVNKPSLDRLKELDTEWAALKARAGELLDKNIPAFNKLLWEAGVGAIWKN